MRVEQEAVILHVVPRGPWSPCIIARVLQSCMVTVARTATRTLTHQICVPAQAGQTCRHANGFVFVVRLVSFSGPVVPVHIV